MKTKVFSAYTGSSVGKTFCVNPYIESGYHNTDCGRKMFFNSFDDLKNYWNKKHSSTSFQEMSYDINLID